MGAAAAVSIGDELFLYATRGAFHNPTRDRGRVFGRAVAVSPIEPLRRPVKLADRTFTHGFRFELDLVAPLGVGVELAQLVPRLATFPNKTGWATRLRRPLLTVTKDDAKLLRQLLRRQSVPRGDAIPRYLAESRTPLPAK